MGSHWNWTSKWNRFTMRILAALLIFVMVLGCSSVSFAKKRRYSSSSNKSTVAATTAAAEKEVTVKEKGIYSDKEHVALYLHTYGKLPSNYITKKEAEALGWNSRQGNLGKVAPGKSIGGSRFGNYENQLPTANKRRYYECDIDFDGTYRNAKRIIYSNDGLVYYTEDHYKTFEKLY